MPEFASRAVGYCSGLNKEQFESDQFTQDAVLRNIELIGEAATRIPEDVRSRYAAIPWRQIVAMRNQLIHGYLGIDLDVVWDVVAVELPLLVRQLAVIQNHGEFPA